MNADSSIRYLINGVSAEMLEQGLDRGLQYGDGVFRTMLVCAGEVIDLAAQLAKLNHDAKALGITSPTAVLEQECASLANTQGQGVLKVILTRGNSLRGYAAPGELQPNRYLYTSAVQKGLTTASIEGVSMRLCKTRWGHNPQLAGIKHLNRLEQVLARSECDDVSSQSNDAEGLMLDIEDHIISGIQSNLFLLREGRLYTPSLDKCGIRGHMRDRILDLARENGLLGEECQLDLEDLYAADEVFLSNSIIGIWPVTQCQHKQWAIGAVTRAMQSSIHHPTFN